MRKIVAIIALFLLFSACEDPGDCVKSTGKMVTKEIPVTAFDRITVRRGIALVITQSDAFSVTVKSGENLIDDIEVKVVNGVLSLTDNTSCNWVRDYGQTTVYVATPTLVEINSKTEQNVTATNVLTYPELKLSSLDLSDGAGTGDFYLEIDNNILEINTNNVSAFFISGKTTNLVAGFYEGNGIFKGQDLIAQTVYVFHRGSNDLYVHPVQSIAGDIFSTGNVYCSPQPPEVSVTRHYKGRLIFQ